MSGGGIIIQRRAVLVPAATDPSIFNELSSGDQSAVTEIANKGPDETTADDIAFLSAKIHEACGP